MFFCFAALLNYLPFILRSTYAMTNTKNIGLVYSGYLLGALTTFVTPYLQKRCANIFSLLATVFLGYSATIALMFWHSLPVFLVAFTCFCASMFIIHATAAPLVNRLSSASASLTNGVYVSFTTAAAHWARLFLGCYIKPMASVLFRVFTACVFMWLLTHRRATTFGDRQNLHLMLPMPEQTQ